jgi:Na+-transporting methylmalonyl-CoA/oxaloacetate decarboxylase gamma subunit
LVVLFFIFLLIFINYKIRKYIDKITKKERELWEEDGRNQARIIMEAFVIKFFGKEKYELKKSNKLLKQIPSLSTKIFSIT